MKERGQGRPEGAPKEEDRAPQKEQAKPKEESELGKLFEEKRLFMAYTPRGRDPESYPIEAMKQIQSEVTERIHRQYVAAEYLPEDLIQGKQMKALDVIFIDKLYFLRASIDKVEKAYEIIAYTFCQNQELKKNIKKDLEKDDNFNGRNKVELNEEELEVIGKMTAIRHLPFDREKRAYYYKEVPDYVPSLLSGRTVYR